MENVENPKAPIKPHFFACHSVGRSVERLAKTGWTFVDKSDSSFSVIFVPHLAGRVFLDFSTPFPRVFHSGERRGDYGRCGGFLGRKPPAPSKNLLTDYGSKDLSRGILPTAKLWWIFAEDSRVCKHPLFASGKNPPEFSPAGENSVPRQGRKPFDLKVKLTYRSFVF